MLAPPVGPMLAEADRRRRRRRLTIGGAVLAVVATLGLADTVTAVVDPGPEAWPATSPPDGMRFVGHRPRRDRRTERMGDRRHPLRPAGPRHRGAGPRPRRRPARGSRPADVRSVAITSGQPGAGFTAAKTYDVEGRQIQRGRTTCARGTCSAVVHLPTENVTFTVSSSTVRPERARAEVAGMVRGLRVLDGRVAVPDDGCAGCGLRPQRPRRSTSPTCATSACSPVVRAERVPGADAGTVTGVSPSPGTPLRRGSDVAVTVADGELTARDEVAVGLGTVDDNRTYRGLTHEDFRRGATLEVPQGTDIWAFADGRRSGRWTPGRRAPRSPSTSGATAPTGRPRGRRCCPGPPT